MKKNLSLVIPCFNEEDGIVNTLNIYYKIIEKLLNNKRISSFEIITVNNGSTDKTLDILKNYKIYKKNLVIVNLFKNYGYTSSYLAGLYCAKKQMIITVTADLHENPLKIIDMINLHYKNNKEILGIYTKRHDTLIKNIFSDLYYFILNFFGLFLVKKHADFRLITLDTKIKLFKMKESFVFLRILILKIIKSYDLIEYEGNKREYGKSKFTFIKSLILAFDTLIYYGNLKKIQFFLFLILIASFIINFNYIFFNINIIFFIIFGLTVSLSVLFLMIYLIIRLYILSKNYTKFKIKEII